MPIHIRAMCRTTSLCAALMASGCGASSEPNRGAQAGAAINDTELMKEASAAVNEAVRNASDCATAKPLVDSARQRLDELEPHVATTTGRVALDSLRSQLGRVAQACP